jgi:hypothetical protein
MLKNAAHLLLFFWNSMRLDTNYKYAYLFKDETIHICKIWDFHGDDYEESRFLGCDAL